MNGGEGVRCGRGAAVVAIALVLSGCSTFGWPDPPDPVPIPSPETVPSEVEPERPPAPSLPVPKLDEPDEGAARDPLLFSPWSTAPEIEERAAGWVAFWQTRGRAEFATLLRRMGRYRDLVEGELAARDLPLSLAALPIIEAGYSPVAVSRVGATGLWQFMTPSARGYGLRVGFLVDERLDPVAATRAATDYLVDLRDRFDDAWFLVLAAYNSGPTRIDRILREEAPGEPRTDELFLRIRERLPRETREFVPKFLAAARIATAPERFGFDPKDRFPSLEWREVTVDDATSLDVLARVAGVEEEAVRDLNPQLRRGYTPADAPVVVRLPPEADSDVAVRLAALTPSERLTFVEHRVESGETFTHIARRYGVGLGELTAANPTIRPRRLQVGQLVVVPRAPEEGERGLRAEAVDAPVEPEPRPPVRSAVEHTVRRGESLWAVARMYGVTVAELRRWNGIGEDDTLFPGDVLTLRDTDFRIHRVQRGDTLWDIARRYGVSPEELARWNDLGSGAVLFPGDSLRVGPSGGG